MFARISVSRNRPRRFGRHRHEANLVALAFDAQVEDAFPLLEIAHLQFAQFFPAQAVVEQRRQDRPIPLPFQGVFGRRVEQGPRLGVAQGRGQALVVSRFGPQFANPENRVSPF